MSLLIFFIILFILVISHEFGHFIVAKMLGIKVDEFGFGFPPRIFGVKFGETLYSLNWLPFGGFVKIYGEDNESLEDSGHQEDKSRSFVNKSKTVQASVIVAGVVFNLLLAWFLVSVGFMSGRPLPLGSAPAGVELTDSKLLITRVLNGSPAKEAGLSAGDNIILLSSGAESIQDPSVKEVQEFIQNHPEELSMIYKRGEDPVKEVSLIPQEGVIEGKYAVGISMDIVVNVKLGLFRAFYHGFFTTANIFYMTILGIGSFIFQAFTGGASLQSVAGPVGLVGIVGDAYGFGFIYLVGLTALISVNLAVLNLIPFPSLDGGRLLFIIIESIKGSPISPRIAMGVNMAGFFALISLTLFITYSDVLKLIGS